MYKTVTSLKNPDVQAVRRLLTSRRERQEQGRFVVEGPRALQTMAEVASPAYIVVQCFCSETAGADHALQQTMWRCGAGEVILLPDGVFERVSDVGSSQGVLAVVQRAGQGVGLPPFAGPLLWCDGIADPGNLGTLIRSASGAGFEAILTGEGSTDFYNPKTVRATMGTFAAVGLYSATAGDLEQLVNAGYLLAAATATGSENAFEARLPRRTVLAVGHETRGLSPTVERLAGKRLFIPLAPSCESLNAAVAGSILMFTLAHVWGQEPRNGGKA